MKSMLRSASSGRSRGSVITSALLMLMLVASVPLAWIFYHGGPGGNGVLASLDLPDGKRYKISQHYNWSTEPYTVSFFMDEGTGKWTWHYVDHEAIRWRNVAMTYDAAGDRVVVTEHGVPRVIVDRKRDTYWLDNGQICREEKLADHRANQ